MWFVYDVYPLQKHKQRRLELDVTAVRRFVSEIVSPTIMFAMRMCVRIKACWTARGRSGTCTLRGGRGGCDTWGSAVTSREYTVYKVPDSRFHNNSNSNNNCNNDNNNNNERATTATDGSRPPAMKYSLCTTTCTGYIHGICTCTEYFWNTLEKSRFLSASAQHSRVKTLLVFYMIYSVKAIFF